MAFLKSAIKKEPGSVLVAPSFSLVPPHMKDFEQWVDLRQKSQRFLRPYEPVWSQNEFSRASFKKRIEFYRRGQKDGNTYAFFLKSHQGERLLGGITLSNIRYGVISSGALGYWIGEPYARRGYMSEALQALLPFSFNRLGLHRLEAACLPHNLASVALLQKNGFIEEGTARKYLQINGKWQDHLLFGLLEEEY